MSSQKKPNSQFQTYTNEVILGVVQPTGTDLTNFRNKLYESASKFSADFEIINLTDFIDSLDESKSGLSTYKSELAAHTTLESSGTKGFVELSGKMHAGTALRKTFETQIFSTYAMSRINFSRDKWMSSKKDQPKEIVQKKIYVLDSLKHPDEINLLREVYGNSFLLIGVSSSKTARFKHLKSFRGVNDGEAAELVSRDESESDRQDQKSVKHGQKMNDVYERADFFFGESCTQTQVDRFLNIIFANPKIAPTRDEQFMHMAASIAAQSSDLSRQVGAILISQNGEILSSGCNDVPKFPGGQYKEGDTPDFRDVTVGYDPNHRRRDQILEKISSKDSSITNMIKNITEYHRAVHAEMETVISCARKGISTVGSTMYATTYPCHNCAKHLLNAGIKNVIYIEAYSKSLAIDLHHDAIEESDSEMSSKMTLQKYAGIGARKYLDYFSLILSEPQMERKGKDVAEEWHASVFKAQSATPKFPLLTESAIRAEKAAMKYLHGLDILNKTVADQIQISLAG